MFANLFQSNRVLIVKQALAAIAHRERRHATRRRTWSRLRRQLVADEHRQHELDCRDIDVAAQLRAARRVKVPARA